MARVQKPKAQSKPGLGRPELAWSMSTYQFNWGLMSGPMNSWSGFMSMNGFKHLTSNSVSDSWVTTEQARFPVPSGGENGEEHSESQLQIPWKTETDKIRFPPPCFLCFKCEVHIQIPSLDNAKHGWWIIYALSGLGSMIENVQNNLVCHNGVWAGPAMLQNLSDGHQTSKHQHKTGWNYSTWMFFFFFLAKYLITQWEKVIS